MSPDEVAGAVDDTVARAWLTAVHSWVRHSPEGRRVAGPLEAPGPGWNYYVVRVSAVEEVLRLVLNAAGKVVAAARDSDASLVGPLSFVDLDDGAVFEQHGFRVASLQELLTEIEGVSLDALTPSQLEDVRYHRPRTVGDLWFNWFD